MSINAQVRFPAYDTPFGGYVMKLSPTQITLQIPDLPEEMMQTACGMEVELSVTSSAGSYMTLVQVESIASRVMVASIFTSFYYEQRRKHRRIQCAWPTMLRKINSDGTFGGWKPARIVDISEGGAAVIIDAQSPSDFWELRLELQQGTSARQYDDSGFNGNSVPKQLIMQVRASTRHHQVCSEGVRLGLAFTPTTPRVSALISHLLDIIERGS